jgi:hypothetical protein
VLLHSHAGAWEREKNANPDTANVAWIIKIINGKTELMELLSDEKFYDLVEPIKDVRRRQPKQYCQQRSNYSNKWCRTTSKNQHRNYVGQK